MRRNAKSLRISLCSFAMHASNCLLSLCMPLCISLSTFPAHASMHFTVYFPCACLYEFHCLLPLCMHLCISLCTCPMHFAVHFPWHASMHFIVYFPCAVELCRTQRLYRKNPSQCLSGKCCFRLADLFGMATLKTMNSVSIGKNMLATAWVT